MLIVPFVQQTALIIYVIGVVMNFYDRSFSQSWASYGLLQISYLIWSLSLVYLGEYVWGALALLLTAVGLFVGYRARVA